jgi:hypothetical protein
MKRKWIIRKVDALQKWDRDFSKVAHLVLVEEPQLISEQPMLFDAVNPIGPTPEDFEEAKGHAASGEEESMKHSTSEPKQTEKRTAEKPISLAPLTEAEAIRGLLQVKPMKGEAVKKVSKKRKAKKTAK